MLYPDFQDMVKYHSDPEAYTKSFMTDNEIEDTKSRFEEGLKRLRSE